MSISELLYKTINKAKRSALFIIISVILVLLSSILTIYQGSILIYKSYNQTLGYKKSLLENIEHLTPDTNLNFFESILGVPVFTNTLENGNTENIFVNDYYFVQTITNENNNVLAYSITTRKENFNPQIKFPSTNSSEEDLSIYLGKTHFADLDSSIVKPDKIYTIMGAHNYYYGEEYYLGNPGRYLTYIFSINQSSGVTTDLPTIRNDEISTTSQEFKNFRKNAVINTYTIISPLINTEELGFKEHDINFVFGPNYNQVRVMPNFYR